MAQDRTTQNSIYARLYTTTVLNLFGDAVVDIALPLALLAATGSISLAAGLAAASQVTRMVLTLPLSAISDRLPRRPVVMVGYAVEGLCLIALAIIVGASVVNLPWVIGLGIVRGAVSELGTVASAGYVPAVLGRENLLRYHSRVETVEGAVAITAPPAGAALVQFVGASVGLFMPALLSFANLILYRGLPDDGAIKADKARANAKGTNPSSSPARPTLREALGNVVPDVAAGLSYMCRNPLQRLLLVVGFGLGASTSGYIFGVVPHLQVERGLDASVVGIIMAASGLGGIVGSLVLEKIFKVGSSIRVLVGAFAVVALCLSLFPVVDSVVLDAVILFVLDIAWVACFIYSGTLEQYVTPDSMMARVQSVIGIAFALGGTLSSGLAAVLVDRFGSAVFLWSIGVLSATVVLCLIPRWGHRINAAE